MNARPLIWLAALLVACGPKPRKTSIVQGGDAKRGKVAAAKYGCGSCHTIPGVAGARSLVGPPLSDIGSRVYVAGVLPNSPDNLIRWISNPPAVDPKTAMPYLGVSNPDARDIAEFLYSLKRR